MPLPTYLMSNFPSVRPSLNLQFDSQPTPEDMTSHLASVGATFSRASIGTYTDANGIIQEATSGQARPNYSSAGVHEGLLIEESRTNLLTASEHTSLVFVENGTATITENQGIAPDGKASANLVSGASGSNTTNTITEIINISSSTAYTFSVYIKLLDATSARIRMFDGSTGGSSSATTTATSEWQRISVTRTSGGSTFQWRLGIEGADDDILVYGAQLEEGSFATSYIPTIPTFTSRASDGTYFDSSGVLQTASTDEERIDHKYIDGQWVEAGLLLEGESTNLHVNSGNLTGNNTAVNEVSLSLQTVTNPIDGQTQVTQIADNAVNDVHFIQSSTLIADGSSDYTFSILAKAGTLSSCRILITGGGAGSVGMTVDLSDGSILIGSGTVQDVGNGWYILSVTATSTASSVLASRVYTTDGATVTYTGSGEYIYVAYRQLEKTSQPTSYIPTSGSTATRSADVYTTATKERSADILTVPVTIGSEVTFLCESTGFNSGGTDPILWSINDNANKTMLIREGSASNFFVNGSRVTMNQDLSFNKAVLSIADGDVDAVIDNGTLVSSSISYPTFSSPLYIGSRSWATGQRWTGSIAKFIIFPRKLVNTEIQKLSR